MGAKKGRSGDVTMDTDFEKKNAMPSLLFETRAHLHDFCRSSQHPGETAKED